MTSGPDWPRLVQSWTSILMSSADFLISKTRWKMLIQGPRVNNELASPVFLGLSIY